MKRFIPTIAILLPLFFAACGPSKTPETNASAASPAAPAATITASPNPVTTGEGPGYYDDNLEYRRRHCGPSLCFGGWRTRNTFHRGFHRARPRHLGSAAGKTFEFRLYAGTEHARGACQDSGHGSQIRAASPALAAVSNSSYALRRHSVWPR